MNAPASLPPFLEALNLALIQSALDRLKERDQFEPFGASMDASGHVALCNAKGADLWEVLLGLKHGFRSAAAAGQVTAGGICVQNRYENPETRKAEISLSCFLETPDGNAVRCNAPYSKGWFGKLKVEYVDTAFGQSPIIFKNDPKGIYFSDQHILYSLATRLIDPYIILQDRPRAPGLSAAQAAADIGRGIGLLQQAIEICPDEPGPLFLLAKAHQALGNAEDEYRTFTRLSEVLPENADVASELTHACLVLGKAEDAVVAADRGVRLQPGDPGKLANLALAYLIAARHSDAIRAITKSLKINASDPTSQNVLMSIRAIVEKKWPQPRNMSELNRLLDKNLEGGRSESGVRK